MKGTDRVRKRAEAAGKDEGREAPQRREKGKYARGYFVGLGIVAGTFFGVPFGFATANPGIIWAGLAIGTTFGAVYEHKFNKGLGALIQ
jgi:uncharacterized membrane protein